MVRIDAEKQIAESMVECRDRLIHEGILPRTVKITYAGRLDPMASGKVIFLTEEDVHKKESYCKLNKIYEIEVFSGLSTDTGDVLGRHKTHGMSVPLPIDVSFLNGSHTLAYPAFSSKTFEGKPLWIHAREGNVPKVVNSWEIYGIQHIDQRIEDSATLIQEIKGNIKKLKGDFRQNEILTDWDQCQEMRQNGKIYVAKYRVSSSSGSYMRQVVEMIGNLADVPVLALSIHRTEMY